MNASAIDSIAIDAALQGAVPQELALDLDVPNRWEALRAVSGLIEDSRGLSAPPVFRALWRREQAASTALGKGFALPHARIPGIAERVTVYARTRVPIGFAAPDHRPVSDIFVVMVPDEAEPAKHVQLLAVVAAMFSDDAFRRHLTAAPDAASVRSTFRRWIDQRHVHLRVASGA